MSNIILENYTYLIDRFIEENSKLNLSAIRTKEDILTKHVVDSLELFSFWKPKSEKTLCDLGTGSGFPLFVLAKELPNIECHGLESIKKKSDAVQRIADDLGIPITMHPERIENFKQEFDILTARAVAFTPQLLQRSWHLLKPGGTMILYKLLSSDESNAVGTLQRKYKYTVKSHRYTLFEGDVERIIYVLKKKR